jgi:hypothetical protein
VVLLYLIAVVAVPLAVGLAIRRRLALAVVFILWLSLVAYFPLTYDWRYIDGDDVTAGYWFVLVVVTILVPAEAVAAAAVVLGRRLFGDSRRSRDRSATRPSVHNGV